MKSFLSHLGSGFLSVFKWLGSAQGQTTVAAAETTAAVVGSAINPGIGLAITGVEALINAALKQVLNMEAAAAAVGAQSGTGAQKSAAVIASLTPQVEQLLVSVGVSQPTAEQVQSVTTTLSNSVVAILNSIPAPATPAA